MTEKMSVQDAIASVKAKEERKKERAKTKAASDSDTKQQKIPTLTSEERSIVDRVQSEDDDWKSFNFEEISDFSLSEDPMKLPEWAKKLQDRKKYAFRWFERDAKRLDEVKSWSRPKKWWVVNSMQPEPSINKDVDPIFGCILKNGQVLHFKLWEEHRAYQDIKMQGAKAKDAAGDISKRDGVKEEWGEWLSGEKVKIGGKDQVFNEDTGSFDMGTEAG